MQGLNAFRLHQTSFEFAKAHDSVGLRVEVHVGRSRGDENLMLTGCQFKLTFEFCDSVWQVIRQKLSGLIVSMADNAEQKMQR